MRVGAVLVQGPRGLVGTRLDRDVADHRHPHVRVRLQAEREDGYADVEHRYDSYHLKIKFCGSIQENYIYF